MIQHAATDDVATSKSTNQWAQRTYNMTPCPVPTRLARVAVNVLCLGPAVSLLDLDACIPDSCRVQQGCTKYQPPLFTAGHNRTRDDRSRSHDSRLTRLRLLEPDEAGAKPAVDRTHPGPDPESPTAPVPVPAWRPPREAGFVPASVGIERYSEARRLGSRIMQCCPYRYLMGIR